MLSEWNVIQQYSVSGNVNHKMLSICLKEHFLKLPYTKKRLIAEKHIKSQKQV